METLESLKVANKQLEYALAAKDEHIEKQESTINFLMIAAGFFVIAACLGWLAFGFKIVMVQELETIIK